MKKGTLLAFFLAIVLVFSTVQYATSANLEVGLSGPYSTSDFRTWILGYGGPTPPQVPKEYICYWHDVDSTWDNEATIASYEITTQLRGEGEIGTDTRSWIFQAGEDIFDIEFDAGESHTLFAGNLEYFSGLQGDGSDFVRFYAANDLEVLGKDTYYDITVRSLDPGFNIDNFDPTSLGIHASGEVPIPSALLLLGSGFVGLVGLRRFGRK